MCWNNTKILFAFHTINTIKPSICTFAYMLFLLGKSELYFLLLPQVTDWRVFIHVWSACGKSWVTWVICLIGGAIINIWPGVYDSLVSAPWLAFYQSYTGLRDCYWTLVSLIISVHNWIRLAFQLELLTNLTKLGGHISVGTESHSK